MNNSKITLNTGYDGDGTEVKSNPINKFKIKPLINSERPVESIGGGELIPECYANVFLLGKKKSGKTTLLFNILKKCANKKTTIYIFSSTLHRDDTYKQILDMLDKKGCIVESFVDFEDEDGSQILADMLEQLKQDNEMKENDILDKNGNPKEVLPNSGSKCFWGVVDEKKQEEMKVKKEEIKKKREEKKERKKKLYPQFIFVFDDMGDLMRSPIVGITQLMKTNRHFKSKVIVSSQALTDLTPAARKQIDFCLCSHSLSPDKLKSLYHDLDLSNTFEEFEKLYNYATSIPYSFLWCDVKRNLFRRNFNEEISL